MDKELTTVIFVRHALPEFNEDDRNRPLTEEGRRDSRIVLETLRDRYVLGFVSSPYRRSIETILEASYFFDMGIHTDERLRERKVGERFPDRLRERWADFSFAEPGGECLQSVQDRNVAALQDILREYAGKIVVVGTHGTALSTILHYYDPSFGADDFLRIVSWMPYIVELTFDGEQLVGKKELGYVDKSESKII